MRQFLFGALWISCWMVGLHFHRFWTASRDRLFVFFSLAFWVLGLHWLVFGIVNPPVESSHYLFIVRLVAFVLIIVGIVDRNRRGKAA